MKTRSLFVVNPRASSHSKATWARIYAAVRKNVSFDIEVAFTERPGHATEIVRRALRDGYPLVVAVGGDGSINEAVNGFFDEGRAVNPDASLGIIPQGTGNDLVKTLQIPRDAAAAARLLECGAPRAIDVGKAAYTALSGAPGERYFVNIADFGCGGHVVDKVNRTTKAFGGRASFAWAILSTLATYRNQFIEFRLDDGERQPRLIQNFVVANGRYFGAGLCPAPEADPGDGLFDVVCFGNLKLGEQILNFPRFLKGKHEGHPKVEIYRARRVEATSKERVLLDLDGDLAGMLPASFQVVPRAIRVMAPAGLRFRDAV